jgi:hypothetical protein
MRRALAGKAKSDFKNAKDPKYDESKFNIPVTAGARTPGVVGMSLSDASGSLGGGYSVTYVYSKKPKGTVIGQSRRNGRVVLQVSRGPAPGKTSTDPAGGAGGGGTPPGGGSTDPSGTPVP